MRHENMVDEPVLEVRDIQGNLFPGLATGTQIFVFVQIDDAAAARRWLAGLVPGVTTAADLLDRAPAVAGRQLNIALTARGLEKLTGAADAFHDLPFRAGMAARSALLGDPVEPGTPGHRDGWVVGGPATGADLLLIAAGARARAAGPVRALPAGLRLVHRDRGGRLDGMREHFGFRDPVSQPGVRGRAGTALLTPRRNPADPGQGLPGQRLVWPGEFVFGYPRQDPMDPAVPGLVARAGPAWARNGSFLVFRRLRQDVAAFRAFARQAAARAAGVAGLAGMTPELMAAKLLGRWPSGAPLVLAPRADDEGLGADEDRVNDFGYAATDPLGLICPPAAHVRKVAPRDHATSMDTVESMDTHRLLRRGVPFGPPYPAPGERGLLFVAYQTSIERQFEFVTRSWLNHPNLREFRDGHDPMAGQRAFGLGPREFALPYRRPDGTVGHLRLDLPAPWTEVTGGGYFFAPSLSALRALARPPA